MRKDTRCCLGTKYFTIPQFLGLKIKENSTVKKEKSLVIGGSHLDVIVIILPSIFIRKEPQTLTEAGPCVWTRLSGPKNGMNN